MVDGFVCIKYKCHAKPCINVYCVLCSSCVVFCDSTSRFALLWICEFGVVWMHMKWVLNQPLLIRAFYFYFFLSSSSSFHSSDRVWIFFFVTRSVLRLRWLLVRNAVSIVQAYVTNLLGAFTANACLPILFSVSVSVSGLVLEFGFFGPFGCSRKWKWRRHFFQWIR